MSLGDWLGKTREYGFVEHLRIVAAQLRLVGHIEQGVGVYEVSGHTTQHTLTVQMEEGHVRVRLFSSVRFPPDDLPVEVVTALMGWKTSNVHLFWDGFSCREWSSFLIRSGLYIHNFSAVALKEVITEEMTEVLALDRMLRDSGYARLPCREVQGYSQTPSITQKVNNVLSRILGGPGTKSP